MPATTCRPAVPATLTTYAVRLEALAGPCPLTGAPLPAGIDEFTVTATDRRHAYRQAPIRTRLPLKGQQVRVFIDGTPELAA